MKEEMMLAGVTLARRYTRKQKEVFLAEVCQQCRQGGWKTEFQTRHSRILHVCNLVIGDLAHAKTVIACAYDTPSHAHLPIRYYPLNPRKNTQAEGRNLALEWGLGAICFLMAAGAVYALRSLSPAMKVAAVLAASLAALFGVSLLHSRGNRVNFNRNSASVALILRLIQEWDPKSSTALVLVDQCCNSYEGLKLLKEACPSRAEVILLDCLAQGEKVVCAHRKGVDVADLLEEDWINKEYEDPDNGLRFFENGMLLASGAIEKHQFVVRHTRSNQDCHVDIPRLEQILEKLKGRMKAE